MRNIKFLKEYYKGYLNTYLKPAQLEVKGAYADFGILNPSIGTSNLGDLIIYESVYNNLREIFPEAMFTNFPTQLFTSYDTMNLVRQKQLLFVSGTNLLSSNLESRFQWKIHDGQKSFLKNKVVLLGCGWWQYQEGITPYTRKIYKSILHNGNLLHSVRDQYTLNKLKSIGIENIVNTSCPTFWNLSSEKCASISRRRKGNVVTTLTFYHRDYKADKGMLEILSKKYAKVHLWIQGLEDINYYEELGANLPNLFFIPPTIEAYNRILDTGEEDYIGTRLHAGARALQKKVRTLILAVDNRAKEIGKDINLNVIDQKDYTKIESFIDEEYITDIQLPVNEIRMWKESLIVK